MGVDLATFRVRIGGFASVVPRSHARLVCKWKRSFMKTICPTDRPGKVFILSLILVLLLRGGVEQNPGPQITRAHHKQKVSLAMPRRRSELKGLTTQPKRMKTELALIMSAMKNFYRKPPINININKVVFKSDVSAQRGQASGTANPAVTGDCVHNVQPNVLHEAVQDQHDLKAGTQPDDVCLRDDDHSLFENRQVQQVSNKSGQHSYQENDSQARSGQTETDLATPCGTDGTDLSGFGLGASVRNDGACFPEDDRGKANRNEDSGDCCDSSIHQVKDNTQKEEKSHVYFDSNPPKDEPSQGENISVEVEELTRLVSITTQGQSNFDNQTETCSSHDNATGHVPPRTNENTSGSKEEASTGTEDCRDNQVLEIALDCENVGANEAECLHVVVQSDQDRHCNGKQSEQAKQAAPTKHHGYRDMSSQTEPDITPDCQSHARNMEIDHTESSSELNPSNMDLTTDPEAAATLPERDKPCLMVPHTDPSLTACTPQAITSVSHDGVCLDSENSGSHNHPKKPDFVQRQAIHSAESKPVDDDASGTTEKRKNESYPGHSKASCCNSPDEQSYSIASDSETEPTFSANQSVLSTTQFPSCPGQSSYTEVTSARSPGDPSRPSNPELSTTQLPNPCESIVQSPSDPNQSSVSTQSSNDSGVSSHNRQSPSQPAPHSSQPRIDPSLPDHMRPTSLSRYDPNSSSSLKTDASCSYLKSLARFKQSTSQSFCERSEHSVSQSQPGPSKASYPTQPTHQLLHYNSGQVPEPTESADRPCEHRQSAYHAALTALTVLSFCLMRFVALFLDSLHEAAAGIEKFFPIVWHRVQRLRCLPSGPRLTTQAESRGPQRSLRCPDVQQELLSLISQTRGQNIQHVDTAHRPSSAPDSSSGQQATGGTTNNGGSHLCAFSGTGSWVDCGTDPPEYPTASPHPDYGTGSWVDCGTDPPECHRQPSPPDYGTELGHDEPLGCDEDRPYPTPCTEDLNSAEGQTALWGSDAEERMGANTYPPVTERIQFQVHGPNISVVAQEEKQSLDSNDELEGETFDLANYATSWVSEVTSRDDAELVTSTEYLVMGYHRQNPLTQLSVLNAYSVHADDGFLYFPDPENVSP